MTRWITSSSGFPLTAEELAALPVPEQDRILQVQINVEMEMFAHFNGASRPHLGGGDQNVHLAHLQVERPQGVVIDVGDDAIQHA